jgi:hypothetical protein
MRVGFDNQFGRPVPPVVHRPRLLLGPSSAPDASVVRIPLPSLP